MHNSPTLPTGSGCRRSSSTSTPTFGSGMPIVTGWPGSSVATVADTAASVGPYVLKIRRPGRASCPTSATGQVSPPRLISRTVGKE